MFTVDVKTVMFSYFMTNALCTGVTFWIWLQYRRHFSGTGHWLGNCIFQTLGMLLIILRGIIPDWASMVVGNASIVFGHILLFRGLELFYSRPGSNIPNTILLLIFTAVEFYFSAVQPDLSGRIINLSLGLILISAQSAWLLFKRPEKFMLAANRTVAVIFSAAILLTLVRIVAVIASPPEENFFLKGNTVDLAVLFSYQMLFILLTFSIHSLISRSLFHEAQDKYSLYRQMFAGHSAIQLLIEPEQGMIVEANPAAVSFYGYSEEQLKKMSIDQINTLPHEYVFKLRQKAKERNASYFLFPHRLASGEIKQFEVYSAPIVVHDQTLLYSIIHDVSRRQKVEKALAQKITQLKANLENTPNVGIQWFDEDGRIIYWNRASEKMQKQAEKERQKLEQHLNQMQKLDSIGVLAGGIAHDFNNLLAGIFGYIDVARLSAKDASLNDLLAKAMQTISRARGLTQQLLTFAKGGAPVKKVEPLFPALKEAALFALSGSNVSCTFEIEDKLWLCNYDRNQICQVVDNLVLNAQQAIPGGMGGLEAQAAIRKISPTIPVFVSSGYSEDPVMAEPEKHGFTASISKPFRRNELAAMLNRFIKPENQA